jgi:hypothetical protein
MGKSWLIRQLQYELAETTTAVYASAETSSVDLFAQRLLAGLRGNQRVGKQISSWEKQVGGKTRLDVGASGLTLTSDPATSPGGVPMTLDILELLSSSPGGPVVLIIDEITRLLEALGPEDAGELLSGLRARRQSGGPPLVLSGSIGLHHALSDLTVVNDLWTISLGAMKPHDAATLSARLLLGIGVEPQAQLVSQIVGETSAIPFYIQAVVNQLRFRDDLDVAAVVRECLARNVWHTEHYVSRLSEYYGREGAARACAVLDLFAVAKEPLDIGDLSTQLMTHEPAFTLSRDELVELVGKLEQDHYLVRSGGADIWSSPLLARIWRHHRMLS